MTKKWTTDKIMQFILAAILLSISILLLNYLSAVLVPFGAAFLIAYILDPLVNIIQKKVRFRIIAVILVLSLITAFITTSLVILIPKVTIEIQRLGVLLGKLLNDSSWRARLNEIVPENFIDHLRQLISIEKISVFMQSLDFWKEAQGIFNKLLPGALGILSGTATLLFWFLGLLLIVMYLIFIMLDMPKLRSKIKQLVPIKYQSEATELAKSMDFFMASYFRAQTIVAMSVGILFATSFSIMGLPMGFFFGLFIGALNMVPYLQLVSIPIALLLGVVYALDTGTPFWQVLIIVTAIYGVIQVIQDLILVPNIIGKSMNLPPIGILLSLSVWGKLLGFLGLIVAIPFTCLTMAYLDKFQKIRASAYIQGENTAQKH